MKAEKALKIKTELNDSNLGGFKASNGWLENFKKTLRFKSDKNSWRSRGCDYKYYQGFDGASSRNVSRLFCR